MPIVAKKYLNYLLKALASLQPAPQNCGAPRRIGLSFLAYMKKEKTT
jgi:hypothetical protein